VCVEEIIDIIGSSSSGGNGSPDASTDSDVDDADDTCTLSIRLSRPL